MEWMEVQDVIEGRSDNFENVIYMWRNKVNGKLYVGQAKNFRKRTKDHKYASLNKNQKYDYNVPLHCAIRKYGIDKFEVCILEFCLDDYEEMNEKEIYYIEKYDTLSKNEKGYNVSEGGKNGNPYAGKSKEDMEDFKKRQSKRMSGENHPMYGKQHSNETKENMRKNHSDSSGGNNSRSRKVVLLNTGEVFDYMGEAEKNIKYIAQVFRLVVEVNINRQVLLMENRLFGCI